MLAGWFSLELGPDASEHVMLSLPESYWLSGCSAGVTVTLGLPGLPTSCDESMPLGRKLRYLGLVTALEGGVGAVGHEGALLNLEGDTAEGGGGQEMVWLIKVSCCITDFTSLRLSQHIALLKNLSTWNKKYTLSNAACRQN